MSEGYYGQCGTLGLATPQANPTAETEFRALLPARVACATVRMVSADPEPANRLRAYFQNIDETLQRFDTLPLNAVALACTGSTYLLGHEHVEQSLTELSQARGYPIVSAAAAIERALKFIGASSIALTCPYPDWLLNAAQAHWQGRGFSIADQFSLDPNQGDTRAIYALSPQRAAEGITARWQRVSADAYLVTGTGLPTLRLIAELSAVLPGPVLSSNLCLAWAALQDGGIDFADHQPRGNLPLLAGWQGGIDRL